jgi:hypothetical protein
LQLKGVDNMTQLEMVEPLPTKTIKFDSGINLTIGEHINLGKQILVVLDYLSDGCWHSIGEISNNTGIQPTSADAQVRNLRKEKHGGFNIEYKRIDKIANYRLNSEVSK